MGSALGCLGRRCRAGGMALDGEVALGAENSPGCGAWAPRARQGLRDLAHGIRGALGRLPRARIGRSHAVVAPATEFRGGARRSLVTRPMQGCAGLTEGLQGVRVVRGFAGIQELHGGRKLTGVGLGDSGRCRGWGSELELREAPWGRVETGQRLVGAGMPQGGVATVEQRLCSGGAMGRGVFRVRGGDAWVDGCREAVGGG